MPGCTEQNWESHLAGAFTLVNHGSFKLLRDRMRDRLTFCNNLYLFHFHLRFLFKTENRMIFTKHYIYCANCKIVCLNYLI